MSKQWKQEHLKLKVLKITKAETEDRNIEITKIKQKGQITRALYIESNM